MARAQVHTCSKVAWLLWLPGYSEDGDFSLSLNNSGLQCLSLTFLMHINYRNEQ